MRGPGARSTQRLDLSHHLLTLTPAPGEAELVAATLWELGAVGIEETAEGLRAAFRDHGAARLARDRLAPGTPLESVPDTFGLDASRDHLGLVAAGPFVVHPPWLEPPSGARAISIDPGHAFGSGSHPSTRLALVLLGRDDLTGSSVVDIGCGTGVLSIGAALLGARVQALDADPAAITATRANAETNGVATAVRVELGSTERLGPQPPDLLLTNVTIDVHEAIARDVPWRPPRLIASGLLTTQVDRCAQAWQLRIIDAVDEGDWSALVLAP